MNTGILPMDSLQLPAVSRANLAQVAGGGKGDPNPFQFDIEQATRAGMPDVFAQGMLVVSYLGRLLHICEPEAELREFSVRFGAITRLGDRIRCSATFAERFADGGRTCVRLKLFAADREAATAKLVGEAVLALPPCDFRN
jgi:acyl dehydratase